MEKMDIKQIIDLHIIDKQLFDINELRGSIPEDIEKLADKLSILESKLKEDKNVVKELSGNKKNYSDVLNDNKEKIKKLNDQVFKVKTNKEYDALLNEIDHLKNNNMSSDENLESIESQLRDKKVSLMKGSTDKDKVKETLADYNKQLNAINKKIEKDETKLFKARKKSLKNIAKDLALIYEKKCQEFGLAFSLISRDACTHCYSHLPAQIIINADDVNILQSCPTCNIFLYKETENN